MENKNINRIYDLWLEKATADPDLKEELLSIKGKDEEILDRFYRSLEFGTAGLRGVIERGYENFVGKLRSIGADIVLERDGAEQCAAAAAE